MTEPVRFVCSGLGRVEIVRAVQEAGGERVQVVVMTDIEGARAVKKGEADYFIGSCATGHGGALAAAIAVLGYGQCTLLGGSRKPGPDEIQTKVESKDWKAFGVRVDQISSVIPVLVQTLIRRGDQG
jgi:Protein of unknown function DUF2620